MESVNMDPVKLDPEENALHHSRCSCKPDQIFRCDTCAGLFGWCLGCFDDMPETCDLCAFRVRDDK
jgi:hypothetical protein